MRTIGSSMMVEVPLKILLLIPKGVVGPCSPNGADYSFALLEQSRHPLDAPSNPNGPDVDLETLFGYESYLECSQNQFGVNLSEVAEVPQAATQTYPAGRP